MENFKQGKTFISQTDQTETKTKNTNMLQFYSLGHKNKNTTHNKTWDMFTLYFGQKLGKTDQSKAKSHVLQLLNTNLFCQILDQTPGQ